jgi:hypothetical protein
VASIRLAASKVRAGRCMEGRTPDDEPRLWDSYQAAGDA